MGHHTVSPPNRLTVTNEARWQNRRRPWHPSCTHRSPILRKSSLPGLTAPPWGFSPVPAPAAHQRAFPQRPPPHAPSGATPRCARSGPSPRHARAAPVSAPRVSPRWRLPRVSPRRRLPRVSPRWRPPRAFTAAYSASVTASHVTPFPPSRERSPGSPIVGTARLCARPESTRGGGGASAGGGESRVGDGQRRWRRLGEEATAGGGGGGSRVGSGQRRGRRPGARALACRLHALPFMRWVAEVAPQAPYLRRQAGPRPTEVPPHSTNLAPLTLTTHRSQLRLLPHTSYPAVARRAQPPQSPSGPDRMPWIPTLPRGHARAGRGPLSVRRACSSGGRTRLRWVDGPTPSRPWFPSCLAGPCPSGGGTRPLPGPPAPL